MTQPARGTAFAWAVGFRVRCDISVLRSMTPSKSPMKLTSDVVRQSGRALPGTRFGHFVPETVLSDCNKVWVQNPLLNHLVRASEQRCWDN